MVKLGLAGSAVANKKLNTGVAAGWILTGAFSSGLLHAAAAGYAPPRNIQGVPDLEGTWTNASLTRFERPGEYGERGVLTQAEVSALEKKNSDLVALGNKPTDPKATVKDLPADCSGGRGENCNYTAAWTDPGTRVMRVQGEPRSSFITSPSKGLVSAFTAEAVANGTAVRR